MLLLLLLLFVGTRHGTGRKQAMLLLLLLHASPGRSVAPHQHLLGLQAHQKRDLRGAGSGGHDIVGTGGSSEEWPVGKVQAADRTALRY